MTDTKALKYQYLLLMREKLSRMNLTPYDMMLTSLFQHQKDFVLDTAPTKAALCSRRAGKTYGVGAMLLRAANAYPGAMVPYLALTARSGYNLLWPVLKEMNEKYALCLKFRESTYECRLPNGSKIMIAGADQKNFIDRLRGGKYPLAVIDEAQSFSRVLGPLIKDVLEPALLDYQGQLALVGTPGPACAGDFFESTTGKQEYSVHKWTLLDNPHLPHAAQWLERLLIRRRWDDNNPTYQREYKGLWVEDFDALVYKYASHNLLQGELPTGLEYVIGVDYGWHDSTAITVVGFKEDDPVAYICATEQHKSWIPSRIAQRLKQLVEQYNPLKIVADTGGLGKSITEEFSRRYELPMVAAEKTEKMAFIELMNGDFRAGLIKVHPDCQALIDQYRVLIKDANGKEDPTLPNDLCDSALYPYRHCYHYLHRPSVELAHHDKLENDMLETLMREEDKTWFSQLMS